MHACMRMDRIRVILSAMLYRIIALSHNVNVKHAEDGAILFVYRIFIVKRKIKLKKQ